MRTHYDNLQVSPTASAEVIRASYRALIQKYHPDKFADPARGARITQILNEAYALLSDPQQKAAYDAHLRIGARAGVNARSTSAADQPANSSTTTPRTSAVDNRNRKQKIPSPIRKAAFISAGALVTCILIYLNILQQRPTSAHQPLKKIDPSTARVVNPTPTRVTATPSSLGVLASAATDGDDHGKTIYTNIKPKEADLKRGSRVSVLSHYSADRGGKKDGTLYTLYRIEVPPDGKDEGTTLFEESFKSGVYKVYTNHARIAPLKVQLPRSKLIYFLKLIDLANGRAAMTMLARGGEVLDIKVPLGTFRLRYAYGSVWYGGNAKFGPDTRASEADADLPFSSDGNVVSGHEIELIQQLGGNLREKPIDPALF